jgi:hypothetical protein
MGTTLYILRQQLDHISPSLFQASDVDIDIVLVDQAGSLTPSRGEGVLPPAKGVVTSDSSPTYTYDDLVEKIFSSERVIVV